MRLLISSSLVYPHLIMAKEIGAYELAKIRVECLQLELTQLQNEKNALAQREQDLLQRYNAWSIILRTEKPLGPATESEAVASVDRARPAPAEGEYGFKTKLAKNIVGAARDRGITPKQLTDAMRDSGIRVSPTFANNALSRMKARNEVTEVDGRYVWNKVSRIGIVFSDPQDTVSFAKGITFSQEVKDQEPAEADS